MPTYLTHNVVPGIKKASHYEEVWRSGGTVPCILNLSARWRLVVSLTPLSLYPWERNFLAHCIRSRV